MFKKIVVNLHAEIDMPEPWYYPSDLERRAELLEDDARELTKFIRDHRSRDGYAIRIVREYKNVCGFCGYEEERDIDGMPMCCAKAQEEFQQATAIEKEA